MRIRYALRRLAKSPGFALTAIASLAIGIGANSALFSVVNAVLLRDPPLENPEELVEIYIEDPDFPYGLLSYPDFDDFRRDTQEVFSGVSSSQVSLVQAHREGEIETLFAELVSGNYFSLLGIKPQVGRLFSAHDDVSPGAHPVVVLGYGYWQRALSGGETVGREIRLNGRLYTIVGVAPQEYDGNIRGLVTDVYLPILMINEVQSASSDQLAERGNHSTFTKARLEPGVTLEEAEVAVEALAARLRQDYPRQWTDENSVILLPSEDVILFPPIDRFVRASAWLLMTVVGLVLLMACVNLASFLLARATDRRKEIAVRLALGATRRVLVGELMTETVLLGLLGGVAGLGVAVFLLKMLLVADLPLPLPITLDLSLDMTVLSYSLAISLVAGVLFGLAPALQSSATQVSPALREETAGAGGAGRMRLRNALVVVQVALSLMLVVGAGLFLRSFQATQAMDPGFGYQPTAILTVGLPSARYGDEDGRLFLRTLLERIEESPGVEAAGLISNLHLNTLSTNNTRINVDGVEPPPGRDWHLVDWARADAGFFDASGVQILRGRNFQESDHEDAPQVVIISHALEQRFLPGEDPIGRVLRIPDGKGWEVIGVASDTKVRSLGEAHRPFVYRPYSQSFEPFATLVARTTLDPERTALDLLATAQELDPEIWVWEVKSLERHIGIQLLPRRLSALLLSVFAALALGLTSIGLYGLVSYAVARRTREVGIRIALGAGYRDVVAMLLTGGMRLVAIGGAIGLVLAFLVTPMLSRLLFGVGTLDLATFLTAPLVLAGVALLAAYLPARRASRVNPSSALRME